MVLFPSPAAPILFQISTRPWLYQLSVQYEREITRLSQVPTEEWKKIAGYGFDMVWLMGIWKLGDYGLYHDRVSTTQRRDYGRILPDFTMSDIIGSPFAVQEYQINPAIATEQELKDVRAALKAQGLKLMLDFVPNHFAVDSPLVESKPDLFVRSLDSPPYDPATHLPNGVAFGGSGIYTWTDTAQVDYSNPATRAMMTKNVCYISTLCDAVRCDMAFLPLNSVFSSNWHKQSLPTEFWSDCIREVRKTAPKGFLFLAETYDRYDELISLGFDYCYDKDLYDRLADGNLDNLRYFVSSKGNAFRHLAQFVENHDEDRAVAHFGSLERANAAAVVSMTLPGLQLYFMGQLQGYKNKLSVQLRRSKKEDWTSKQESEEDQFYRKLISVVRTDPFRKGEWSYRNVDRFDDNPANNTNWRLVAWSWEYNGEVDLVVVNYSDSEGQGLIKVNISGDQTLNVKELLHDQVYARSATAIRTSGLHVVLPPWYAQVFRLSNNA